MKKGISLLSLLGIIMLFSSCSTDVVLEGEWKDIPIVYGFISEQDTAHYIRVEKAFLEENGNANDIAQIVDSLYYSDDLVVALQKGEMGTKYILQRVDGNVEGYQRQSGPFADAPNYLYKIKSDEIDLENGDLVQLSIDRGEEEELITAKTYFLPSLGFRENRPANPISLGHSNSEVRLLWDVTDHVAICDVRLIFNYKEKEGSATEWEDKSLEWILDDGLINDDPGQDFMGLNFKSKTLLQFIGGSLEVNNNLVREFSSIDLHLACGGEEIKEYKNINQVNTGITSANEIPSYTNLSEGRGIFAARSRVQEKGFELSPTSLDSLANGQYTHKLNFLQ